MQIFYQIQINRINRSGESTEAEKTQKTRLKMCCLRPFDALTNDWTFAWQNDRFQFTVQTVFVSFLFFNQKKCCSQAQKIIIFVSNDWKPKTYMIWQFASSWRTNTIVSAFCTTWSHPMEIFGHNENRFFWREMTNHIQFESSHVILWCGTTIRDSFLRIFLFAFIFHFLFFPLPVFVGFLLVFFFRYLFSIACHFSIWWFCTLWFRFDIKCFLVFEFRSIWMTKQTLIAINSKIVCRNKQQFLFPKHCLMDTRTVAHASIRIVHLKRICLIEDLFLNFSIAADVCGRSGGDVCVVMPVPFQFVSLVHLQH